MRHRMAWLGLAVGLAVLGTIGGTAGAAPGSPARPGGDAPAAPDNGTYQTLPFSQAWSNTGLITADDDWSAVPGIIGYRGDDLVTTTGADPQTVLADGTTTPVDVIANQANPDTLSTGGVAEFEITNPVVALQGSGTADAPFTLVHFSTAGVCGINVGYAVRDIDGSADNAVQPVALHFRVGASGNFTNVPAAFVADATTGPNQATQVTNVSVALPMSADNQAQVQVRMMTTNAVGNDEWVGIDDISITAGSCQFTPTPTATPIPTPVFLPENTSFNLSDPFDCTAPGDTLEAEVAVANTGAATAFGSELALDFPARLVGVPGTCTFTGGANGTCTIDEIGLRWRGDVPSTAPNNLLTLNFSVRVAGGTVRGTEICATSTFRWAAAGTGPVDRSLDVGACTEVDCLPTVDPNRQLSGQVHLPILDFQGQDDVCRTWIEIQQLGCDPAKAVLVTWGAPGFCPPQAAGPLKVECTGMLVPGASWVMQGAQIPTGAKSGILFKFTARSLSEVGIDLGFDDVVADMMCEELFFGVVGDADDYRRFKKAYNEGLEFRGIPQRLATADGYLAVEVLRHCPGDLTPGAETSGKYNGIAGTHLGAFDPVFGGYAYYVPLVYAAKAGFDTIMYIQNGGLECSSVEIWFKAQDDCLRATICDIATLAPGETFQLDASECVGPDWQGSAWIRTSEPMGVAVDVVGRDLLMTYVGEPAELNYTFDPAKPYFSGGNQVAFGPLIYSEYQGWDTGVQVMNLSPARRAKVKVYFLDRSGDVITTLVDWICERGSQTYFLPVVHDLPGNWVGSVRVESQEWWAPGTTSVSPPNVVGVVTLIKYTDAARTQTAEAVAYNLLPEHKAFDWQVGANAGGLESGVGLIAVPSLLKDLEQQGITSELAIQNVVPKPGFTDFAIYIFDQNGLLDYVCQKLHDRQVEYIDMRTWGYVGPGFKGSAIVSATFWEHEVFDNGGFFLRNLVGLAAVTVERTGTRQGDDIPGDESAASRGIPFSPRGIDEPFAYCFAGPAVAFCPGQPGERPGCPAKLEYAGKGGLIPDDRAGGEMFVAAVPVNFPGVPGQCKVEDVDLFLEIEHDVLQDLDVFLDHAQVRSEMFTDICGFEANVLTTLDDDALAPITTMCPPIDDGHYQTESGTGLNRFDGIDPKGPWTLMIDDDFESTIGTGEVVGWKLVLTIGEAP